MRKYSRVKNIVHILHNNTSCYYYCTQGQPRPLVVICATNFASALLIESGLSFLGIGAQPPVPSWGGMIREYYPYLITGKAYLSLIPGALIAGSVLSLNTLSTVWSERD